MPVRVSAPERQRARMMRERVPRETERGRESRKEGTGEAYLLFLASTLPPPLAVAERAGCSDDTLWRISTSWPLSLRHRRTASSLWGWTEGTVGREGGCYHQGDSPVLSPAHINHQ